MADTPVAHSLTPESRHSRSRPLSRSPPRWAERRGRSERRTSEIVVERVVERVTSERIVSAGNFPVLTKTNYYDWATLMRVMLQARGLWDAVIVGTTDYTEDRLALEVIAKAVPPELMGSIASKPSVKAAWESLVLRNVGVDRVRKAKASTLKREFDLLTFEAGESIDDFGTRLSQITNQLAVLGFEYKEEEIVR
jgi:cyclopropane fatty-acyl-phospholipid synthase-like methyltransferase